MMLTKNTVVGMSLATLVTFVGVVYGASVKIQSLVNQVDDNTYELAAVVKSLELSRIDRQIANAEAEIREIDRYLMDVPNNQLLIKQRAALEAEVIRLRIIRTCVVSSEGVCE